MPRYYIDSHHVTVINTDNRMPILMLPYGILPANNPNLRHTLTDMDGKLYDLLGAKTIFISSVYYTVMAYDVNASKFIAHPDYPIHLDEDHGNHWQAHPKMFKLIRSLMTSSTAFSVGYNSVTIYARSMIWYYSSDLNTLTHCRLDYSALGVDPAHEVTVILGDMFVFVLQHVPGQRCNRIFIQSASGMLWQNRKKLILQLPHDCNIEQAAPAFGTLKVLVRFDDGKIQCGSLSYYHDHNPVIGLPRQYDYLLSYIVYQRVNGRFIEYEDMTVNQNLDTTIIDI